MQALSNRDTGKTRLKPFLGSLRRWSPRGKGFAPGCSRQNFSLLNSSPQKESPLYGGLHNPEVSSFRLSSHSNNPPESRPHLPCPSSYSASSTVPGTHTCTRTSKTLSKTPNWPGSQEVPSIPATRPSEGQEGELEVD